MRQIVQQAAALAFPRALVEPMVNYIMGLREPTFHFDAKLTAALAERSARQIMPVGPSIRENEIIVRRGETITSQKYRELEAVRAESARVLAENNPWAVGLSHLGRVLLVMLITGAGALYVWRLTEVATQVRHAWAVCGLLLLTLAIAKTVASIAPQSIYFVGLAPTLLTAIILVIAYNQRFALGMAALHGLLVTITAGAGH